MAPVYPSGIKTFVVRVDGVGNIIFAANVNDLQDEVNAVETGLINGFQHVLKPLVTNAQDIGTVGALWRSEYLATTLFGTQGTITANTPFLNLTSTWNAVAVTFQGILLNVTDTASAAASIFLDLQKAGVSQFKVDKGGNITAVGILSVGGPAQTGIVNRFRMLQSMARSHSGVAQSIPNSLFTALTFDTNDFNTDAIWSAAANTRFTAQIAGKYLVIGGVSYAVTPGTNAPIVIRKNGVTTTAQSSVGQVTGTGIVSDIILLAATDYVEILVFQSTGAAINAQATQSTFGGMTYIGE